jgi:AcrR family transcriptional regulator
VEESVIHPRERIFLAAQKLFAARGYQGTAVQDIVAEAGVTKPTLYYYYENKEQIYCALVEKAYMDRLKKIQEAVEEHHSIRDKLLAAMQALVDFCREHNDLTHIAYANVFAPQESVPESVRGNHFGQKNWQYIHGIIQNGIASGEIDDTYDSIEVTNAIYGQFLMVISVIILHPEVWQPQWGDHMIRFVLDGIGQGQHAQAKTGNAVSAALPVAAGQP